MTIFWSKIDFLRFFSYIIDIINLLKEKDMKNWKELMKKVTLTDVFIVAVTAGYVIFISYSVVSAFIE